MFNVELIDLILMFFAYSFVGWLNEVFLIRISSGHFVNRGFLIGPYCPVYGTGGVLITLCLSKFEHAYFVLFGMSMIICTTLEYIVSWIMEILFHARWWDYSDKPLNLNGRVWLGNAVLFGLAGVFVIKGVNPIFFHFLDRFSNRHLWLMAFVLLAFFLLDFIFSFVTIYHFRNEATQLTLDATEEIVAMVKEETKELKEYVVNDMEVRARKLHDYVQIKSEELRLRYDHRSYMYRRLIHAYPKFKVRSKNIEKLRQEIHEHFTHF